MAREAVKLAGDEYAALALESKGKPGILHAKENETVGCSESGVPIIENKQDFSEGGVLYNERR